MNWIEWGIVIGNVIAFVIALYCAWIFIASRKGWPY